MSISLKKKEISKKISTVVDFQKLSPEEYRHIALCFNFSTLPVFNLDPKEWIRAGGMNSHEYRKQVMSFLMKPEYDATVRTMILVFALAVRSKKRILNVLERFIDKPWYDHTYEFFNRYTCQYAYEASKKKVSVVHIISSLPFMAALIWKHVSPKEARKVENLLKNLWAAQLNLNSELQAEQKAWEIDFLNKTVTSGGPNYQKGFNPSFYETKSLDNYGISTIDGKSSLPTKKLANKEGGFTRDEIQSWLNDETVNNSSPYILIGKVDEPPSKEGSKSDRSLPPLKTDARGPKNSSHSSTGCPEATAPRVLNSLNHNIKQ